MTLDRHSAGLTSAVFSPDGSRIVTVSDDDESLDGTRTKHAGGFDTIRVWDAEPRPDWLAGEQDPQLRRVEDAEPGRLA